LIAWLPEFLLFGRPQIIDICSISGKSIAKTRDTHYHNPPDYLVLEPEDTTERTSNLQQTNTNGYKFQGDKNSFYQAKKFLDSINDFSYTYEPTPKYQTTIRKLFEKFKYRLDTNYAKIDRIVQPEIELFKTKVLNSVLYGNTINNWAKLFSSGNEKNLAEQFKIHLSIE
jgi:hypothetical protein